MKIDKKDLKILKILQKDCKKTAKEIARAVDSKPTTVYAKISKMEELGLVKGYHAVLDHQKLNKKDTAIIHSSVSYQVGSKKLSQREIAKKVAAMPEVQDVFMVAGEWDLILKVKAESTEEIGKFIMDRLRKIEGIDKVRTSMVFDTAKESLLIEL